ncbi:MAG: putative lipid II flippase FtsW [Oscillospiraceae bacterium]|nr:putative lipid II flippase FtsW [Oscillospiraceae bacterium]
MTVSNALAPEKQSRRERLFSVINGFDMPFLSFVLLLLAVGLVALFSASFAFAYYWEEDSYFYIKKQIIFAVIGIAAMLLISTIDYHVLHKLAIPVILVSVGLLVLVLALSAADGIHRWIRLPGGFQFQPSEVAKFGLIVMIAHMIAINHKKMKTFKAGFLPFIILLGIVCALVFREPHLSGTILLLSIGLVMMFIGGTGIKYLAGTLGLGSAAVYYMVFVKLYERERVEVWLDPVIAFATDKRDAAWQIIQSLYAIGAGGLMGQGLGNSRQKHMFLPEPHNDFIFAVICEEMGFIGAVIVIILFALLVWRGFLIGMRAPDKFGSMLAIGLTVQIGLQALMNLAVVTNTIPNTGISLPFFSYGGTSLVMLLAQMGVVLSISRQMRGGHS